MSSTIQTSYTSGALDPLMRGRIDAKHYYSGGEILRNVITNPLGGASMRDGTEYNAQLPGGLTQEIGTLTAPEGLSFGATGDAEDADISTVVRTNNGLTLISVPYAALHVDFGVPTAITFVQVNGAQIVGSDPVVLTNEWEVQYSHDDAAWTTYGELTAIDKTGPKSYSLSQPLLAPITARYWRVVRVTGTDQPNNIIEIADFLLFSMGAPTGGCKMIAFEFDINQRYMMVLTDRVLSIFEDGVGVASLPVPYLAAEVSEVNYTQSLDTLILVHENHPPQLVQRQGSSTAWAVSAQPFVKIPVHAFAPVSSNPISNITPDVADGTGTLTASAAIFLASHVDQQIEGGGGRIRITEFLTTTTVKYVTLFPFFTLAPILSGDWTLTTGFEAVWSATRGWPRSITFHEARTVIGGSRDRPSTIWLSRAGQFFDFDAGQFLDDDAIDATLQADDQPIIINVRSGTTLQIFTSSGEYFAPQLEDQPLTPSNFGTRRTGSRGSEPGLRTIEVAGETLFVQRLGKAVREFVYNETDNKYAATNISQLSSHLINNPTAIAARKTTASSEADLVILINGDGTYALLTTLRDQEVTAWVSGDTPGASGLFKCVGVDLDQIYFVIQRTIGGLNKLFLERFSPLLRADCGKVQTVTGTTVSGLDHLEGETVRIVIDGALHADKVVTAGAVTLDLSVTDAVVEVGLAYSWTLTDLPIVRELADGTRLDGKKRVIEIIVELFETKDIVIDGQRPAFRQFGPVPLSPLDAPIIPFTGRKRIEGRLGYDDRAQVTLSGDLPLPATVLLLEKRVIAS